METQKDWFTSWFNTPYYHILYKDRNDDDAQFFMQNITQLLQLDKDATIADIPCGKGRHSVYLNSLGYNVIGADLSENSIAFAKQFENEKLHFEVCDMRKSITKKYDVILNLFTSFGYFEDDEDDIAVLKNFKNGLKPNGVSVIDFLNVDFVKANLVEQETKTIDGINFHISRKIEDGFIIKQISFVANNEDHCYFEKVKYINLEKFTFYLQNAGLKIKHIFGDYQLSNFDVKTSKRLIFVVS